MNAGPRATAPSEVRQRAEALWRKREHERPRSDSDTTRVIQELQIHQIELEIQNQSLLETQAELTATQAQLSRALDSYRELYDLAPAGCFTVASDGCIREVNRGGETLLGRPRDDLLGRRLGVFVAVGDLPSFNALISRVLGTGDGGGCEISIDDVADGPKRVRIDASRSSDSSTCLLVVVDVTAAWTAERALRSSERQLRELMEALPQQVWTATAAGALTHVSQGAAIYSGMSAEEIVASGWGMLIHDDDRPRWKKHWAAALAAARACEIDLRLRRADGSYRWHAVMARPLREGSDAVTMWIGTNTDVTFLRQLEDRRLETSAAQERTRAAIRFREGIECVSDGLALWDPEERLVACNSAFAALLPDSARALLTSGGTQREIASAMLAADEPGMSAAERAAVIDERMAQSADPGRSVELTLRDGRVIEFSRRRTSDGGSLSIHHDVTARKRHADDLEKALGVERAANAMQQRFVSIVSHEFRTPLTIIDGAAQRALRLLPEADTEVGAKLQRIRDSVARMVALIDRTLSQDRMMSGHLEFQSGIARPLRRAPECPAGVFRDRADLPDLVVASGRTGAPDRRSAGAGADLHQPALERDQVLGLIEAHRDRAARRGRMGQRRRT
jgi:PAS domain S-box-containing protein